MEPLLIKGLNNTLILIFNKDYSGEEYCRCLQERLQSNPKLFRGSPVLFKGPGLQTLTFHDINKLQRICLEHDMVLDNVRSSPTVSAQRDVFLRRHIRSGQIVHADGSIVVWGDVHEGAELYAGVDIIVLGKLAGMAHAGHYGNTHGIIFCLELAARWIRVAQLSVACDKPESDGPMVAYADKGSIQIQSYRTKEQLRLSFKPTSR